MPNRRDLTHSGLLAIAAFGAARVLGATSARAQANPAVVRTDAEWRKLLTPGQYAVLRQDGTERPFTSALLHEERQGVFGCAGCALPLFSSSTKFDSRTGWPSFWAPLENNVATKEDRSFGTVRTAVMCGQCAGHLGHVFKDGPKPTGLRYCMNGVALQFSPAAA